MTEGQTAERILTYSSGAALAAGLLLVVFVLPAEYGIDPLRTGRLFGLTGLADTVPTALAPAETRYHTDTAELTLAPFEWLEYKYRLEEGAGLVFSWQASGTLLYDFHAEPDGADGGITESFSRGRDDHADGTYLAPFSGVHGWYFENRGNEEVTLRLATSGFYGFAKLYRDDVETAQPLGEIF